MAKQSGEPRKVRWTVPAVDTSVIDWLDEQENISQSLRLLIRESIQRDGYIDVVYKPVDQLPRRGRPPLESTGQLDDEESEVDRRPAVRSVQPRSAATDVDMASPESEAQRSTAKSESAPAPAEKAEEPETSAAPQPPKQASIDEIMASTRR